jgi:hypothetical protein
MYISIYNVYMYVYCIYMQCIKCVFINTNCIYMYSCYRCKLLFLIMPLLISMFIVVALEIFLKFICCEWSCKVPSHLKNSLAFGMIIPLSYLFSHVTSIVSVYRLYILFFPTGLLYLILWLSSLSFLNSSKSVQAYS